MAEPNEFKLVSYEPGMTNSGFFGEPLIHQRPLTRQDHRTIVQHLRDADGYQMLGMYGEARNSLSRVEDFGPEAQRIYNLQRYAIMTAIPKRKERRVTIAPSVLERLATIGNISK